MKTNRDPTTQGQLLLIFSYMSFFELYVYILIKAIY